ncbi:MAG: hypothetical protein HYY01_10585 [Chloroflexi bacterium]|nr:hypothetical protein [Chloroflexota bacterium]
MSATYPRFPDVNILPQEYRPRGLSRVELAIIAVLLIAAVVLPLSLRSYLDARSHISELRAEQQRITTAAARLVPQTQQADKLRQEVSALQANLDRSKKLREALRVQRTDWGPLLVPLIVSLPSGIELTSVVRAPKLVTVEGVSRAGFPDVALYYSQLNAAPGVAGVTITKTNITESKDLGNLLTFNVSIELVNE